MFAVWRLLSALVKSSVPTQASPLCSYGLDNLLATTGLFINRSSPVQLERTANSMNPSASASTVGTYHPRDPPFHMGSGVSNPVLIDALHLEPSFLPDPGTYQVYTSQWKRSQSDKGLNQRIPLMRCSRKYKRGGPWGKFGVHCGFSAQSESWLK